MNSFTLHLKDIIATISVDEDRKKFVALDFAIIREYILEILKKHSLFKHLLTEPSFIGKHFNTSIVLDFSKIFKLNAFCLRNYPACVQVIRKQRIRNNTLLGICPEFLSGLGPLDGVAISKFVRATLKNGLEQNGCFIRGHQGDIYELDMVETPKENVIAIEAVSDNITILIDLRILMNLAPSSTPTNPDSFPLNASKRIWLVRAEQCKNTKIFAIVTPFNESLMASHQSTAMAYRLLAHLIDKMNLYNMREEVLVSTIYEVIYSFHKIGGKAVTAQTVAHIIFKVLQRIVGYFEKGFFPYYFDTRINMLKWYKSINTVHFMHKSLGNLLHRFYAMNANRLLSYDEVQEFFGIEIKNDIFKVDHLGVYKLF